MRAQTSTQNHRTVDFFCPETSILRLAGHQFLSVPREAGKCTLRVRLMGSDSNSISRPVSSEEGQFQKSPPSSRLVPLIQFCCFCLVERALKKHVYYLRSYSLNYKLVQYCKVKRLRGKSAVQISVEEEIWKAWSIRQDTAPGFRKQTLQRTEDLHIYVF